MTGKKMSYMEALGALQDAIKLVTPEDVADAINDTFSPIQMIEIQDMLYQHRQHVLQAELKNRQDQETIEKPPQKKGGPK